MYAIAFKGQVISTHADEDEARAAWHKAMDAAEDHDNRLLDYSVRVVRDGQGVGARRHCAPRTARFAASVEVGNW
jgi:hypothetical protein